MRKFETNTLDTFNLRNTGCRKAVLDVFSANDQALSQFDLEQTLGSIFDRTTIFRTLKTFLKKGLIHKVLDEGGGTKYAITKISTEEYRYFSNHIHFKCSNCNAITCISGVGIPHVELPEGYSIEKSNILFGGVCSKCSIKTINKN